MTRMRSVACLAWNGRPIAFHFGFCYSGKYLFYKPSFALDMAHYSPGLVLLRHLMWEAFEENARTFDFGLGEEAFKARFATTVRRVRTWGLYEPTAIRDGSARGVQTWMTSGSKRVIARRARSERDFEAGAAAGTSRAL